MAEIKTEETERDDDFGVWMFQHGKGKEVAKRAEEFKKKLKEEAKMKAEIDCGGVKEMKLLDPKRETETGKKSARTLNERPKKMKDGTIKWAGKTFKTEKELDDYILKNTLFIDGKK